MDEKNPEALTQGSRLAKNVSFSFLGKIFPLVAGVLSVPILIQNLGTDKFGVLAIIWLLIGYFGILDFGFSRSIIYELGKDIKKGVSNLNEVVGTIITVLLIGGSIIGFIIIMIAPILVNSFFELSDLIAKEVIFSFTLIGFGIPITMVGSAIRGVLETFQDFKRISIIDSFSGGLTYLGLAAISLYTSYLPSLVLALLIIKISVTIIFYVYSKRFVMGRIFTFTIKVEKLKSAYKFAKWIAVSNVIGPIMEQADRYLIGAIITMTAVTYYTAPLDVIVKIGVIPMSIAGVLFPAFTVINNANDEASKLFSNSILASTIVIFPISAILIFFAEDILFLWLGSEFVEQSTLILQVLIIGSFFNLQANIPNTYIQGVGRPDIPAKIHFSELLIYIPFLWVLINAFGIFGAAIGRTVRVILDWALLIFCTKKLINAKLYVFETLALCGLLIVFYYLSLFELNIYYKLSGAFFLIVAYSIIIWKKYLDREIKELVLKRIQKR